jgi:hypothetical protein
MPIAAASTTPNLAIDAAISVRRFAKRYPSPAYKAVHRKEPRESYARKALLSEPSIPANGGVTPSNPGMNFARIKDRRPHLLKALCAL